MNKLRSTVTAAALALAAAAVAQSPTIVGTIEADSIITVIQPAKLAERLNAPSQSQVTAVPHETAEPDSDGRQETTAAQRQQRVAGFRVQVFSDNNARTAQAEAKSKSVAIADAMPHYRTYVTYDAPYWRLRVGDFRSRTDAEQAADEIKALFPAYSREVRVVRDRINVAK